MQKSRHTGKPITLFVETVMKPTIYDILDLHAALESAPEVFNMTDLEEPRLFLENGQLKAESSSATPLADFLIDGRWVEVGTAGHYRDMRKPGKDFWDFLDSSPHLWRSATSLSEFLRFEGDIYQDNPFGALLRGVRLALFAKSKGRKFITVHDDSFQALTSQEIEAVRAIADAQGLQFSVERSRKREVIVTVF